MSAVDKWKKRAEGRIARAIRWRADALEVDPSLRTLIRPRAGDAKKTVDARRAQSASQGSSRYSPAARKFSQHRFSWGAAYFDIPVASNKVFYESFAGNGALCNPRVIFDALLKDPRAGHLEHVWSFKNKKSERLFLSRYGKYENVRTVKTESAEYWAEVCTAKYLFNNATFPQYFTKRPEQVYVNTWHGTPLKKMGYHANEGPIGAANVLRNFIQADYLVSANSHMTETMFLDAYRLRDCFPGEILEEGYPRVDLQFESSERKGEIAQKYAQFGLKIDENKPTVLYAPTWRGESFHSASADIDSLRQVLLALQKTSGGAWNIALKLHQQVADQAENFDEFKGHLVPNDVETNELLGMVDVLVSDYSSVWIDYLALRRPIIFFTPDFEKYDSLRGLYFDSVPGPDVDSVEQLSTQVSEALGRDPWVYLPQISEWAERLCPSDDGRATSRIIDRVFDFQEEAHGAEKQQRVNRVGGNKTSILIFLGGMKNNGITTAALNILASLDPDKYDITAWGLHPGASGDRSTFDRVPSHVRLLLRAGSHPLTEERHLLMDKYVNDGDADNYALPSGAKEAFHAEWARNFGELAFDHIIDFSGYAGFWSLVLAQGEAIRAHSVWLHNDLQADRLRQVGSDRPHFTALTSQFKAYQFYDNLVSVSRALQEINCRSLSGFAPVEKFKSARNAQDIVNIEDVLNSRARVVDPDLMAKFDLSTDVGLLRAAMAAAHGSRFNEMIDRELLLERTFGVDGAFNFICAGRLSPEKNHDRLVRAFAEVHRAVPNSRLIIVGDGPLRAEIEGTVGELELKDSVVFTGLQPQALDFIARADCFVMSSDYEGQPMVITEALSVGVPVVTVEFDSVRDAFDPENGLVVEQTVESLAQGMISIASGRHEIAVNFDVAAYNSLVVREFEHSIGVV